MRMHIHMHILPFYLLILMKIPPKGVKGWESMRKAGWVEGSKENVVLIEKRKVLKVKQNRE